MKVRNTHCVEFVLTPADLAKALGQSGARLKDADIKLEDGKIQSVRLHFEYDIASRGFTRKVHKAHTDADLPWGG